MAPTIVINVADYHGKCPNCLESVDQDVATVKETQENYATYRQNAAQRFGDYNLPLCLFCWAENTDGCYTCFLPMGEVVFGCGLGNVIMQSTTIAAGKKDSICDHCRVK